MSSMYTPDDADRLEQLLEKKLFSLAALRQKPGKTIEELEELELTIQILKFVQHLAQKEGREIRYRQLMPSAPDYFHQSVSTNAVSIDTSVSTICTNCKQKNPSATHCVHNMYSALDDELTK